jgi:nitroreductase
MEAGHAAQNIYLQATALGLGTVTIGAFVDELVKEILSMPEDEAPLYIIPVGRKA